MKFWSVNNVDFHCTPTRVYVVDRTKFHCDTVKAILTVTKVLGRFNLQQRLWGRMHDLALVLHDLVVTESSAMRRSVGDPFAVRIARVTETLAAVSDDGRLGLFLRVGANGDTSGRLLL